ncbi:MAG: carboxylating nicotinate-nucleotide diphosphorylase [Chthoniobacterales bacterium]
MEQNDPVAVALAEDIGTGDLTSKYFIPEDQRNRARIFAKEPAVVAGTTTVQRVFHLLDPAIQVRIAQQDGTEVGPGDTVLEISGPTRTILTGERVALNFLQRLSGIATLTRRFVEQVRGTAVEILDTRKTTPGLRQLEKAAVKAGGGGNHRMGLYDGVMVKDNHLLARPSLRRAIREFRAQHLKIPLEIEADSIEQVRAFVAIPGVDVILLDNMSPGELRACVALRQPGVKFEASGGITLDTVRAIAETGVDYISVGQLTHSARAIDFSLELLNDSN